MQLITFQSYYSLIFITVKVNLLLVRSTVFQSYYSLIFISSNISSITDSVIFQSYYSLIFIWNVSSAVDIVMQFQSYYSLIFIRIKTPPQKKIIDFNPIIVLFSSQKKLVYVSQSIFQSYYSLIFIG